MEESRAKILLVDDNETNLIFLEDHLSELENAIIFSVKSGNEALQMIQKHEFALVILDVQMPGLNGFDTLDLIRENEQNKNLPVIFVSGIFTDEENILRGVESGAIDFITKPVNPDVLKGKVKIFIDLYAQKKYLHNLIQTLKITNQQLEKSENTFRSLTLLAYEAIVLLDEKLSITFFNKAAERIFGYSQKEALALTFQAIAPKKNTQNNDLNVQHNIFEKSSSDIGSAYELEAQRKNGEKFPIELSISSFILDNIKYHTCIIRDLTRRKEIEQELLRAKETREANRVMREFIDNLSHEIRTPLNAIQGISNNLLKYNLDELGDKQKEAIKIIHSSSKRLNTLIENLFELKDNDYLQLDNINLDEIAEDCKSFGKKSIGNKPIEFQFSFDGNFKTLKTNKNKLQLILNNLIENAIKFTEKGYVKVNLSLNINYLLILVEDTGIGIKKEDQNKLFREFTQIDGSTSRKYTGAGIGLALVNKIVTQFQGEIKLDSVYQKGTKIEIKIPVPQ